MGTVLSFSPRPRKPTYEDINLNNFGYEVLQNAKNQTFNCSSKEHKTKKTPSMFINPLSLKRFGVSSKKKDKAMRSATLGYGNGRNIDGHVGDVENNNIQRFQKSISCYALKTVSFNIYRSKYLKFIRVAEKLVSLLYRNIFRNDKLCSSKMMNGY